MDFVTLDSWQHAEPNFSNPAVYVPAFKRSLQPGHFVKVVNDANIFIGRIIATQRLISEHQQLQPVSSGTNYLMRMNWYSPRPSLVFSNVAIAKLASTNIYLSDNMELLQMKTTSWIDTSLIKELCFMFSYIDIIDGSYCCEGIAWSNCFSIEVWESVVMQQAITTMLCRYSQSQGCHPSGHVRVSIPSAMMSYMSSWLMPCNVYG